jgi:DNA sulfur modification protein DndD
MHKKDFINKVEVSILPEKAGLAVDLYDSNNDKIPPEALSSGEKQLYISCLLKAILHESVTELPVFIDTPLGRLDKEHKDNILRYYYPNLTSQVVIFPTNEEIGHNRLSMIKNKVHKTYLLKNSNNKTQIEEGYF